MVSSPWNAGAHSRFIPTVPSYQVASDYIKKTIDQDKWVYIFRKVHVPHGHSGHDATRWAGEIKVEKGGLMYAIPMDGQHERAAPHARPQAQVIGKTMCLPRRLFGNHVWHYFFASAIRLDMPQIETLEATVSDLCPPVTLECEKERQRGGGYFAYAYEDDDGTLIVPVVEPLTIALHLHTLYTAAVDDLLDYTVPNETQPGDKRKAVLRRRQKHLLASIVDDLTGARNDPGGELKKELKHPRAVKDFLLDYDRQVRFRVTRRDNFARLLSTWMTSSAMDILADACAASPAKLAFVGFLKVYLTCLGRTNESPVGRTLLGQLLDKNGHFIHQYVLPQSPPASDDYQIIRKTGFAVMEAWKEFGAKVLEGGRPTEIIVRSLSILVERRVWIETPEISIMVYGRTRVVRVQRLVIEGVAPKAVPRFECALGKVGLAIEVVNLLFAFKSVRDAYDGSDARAQRLALVGVVGSSLDAVSAIGPVLKVEGRALPVIGMISGSIDVYLGIQDTSSALDRGDDVGAAGMAYATAGSAISTVGSICLLVGAPTAAAGGASSWTGVGALAGILGLTMVGIGYTIKVFGAKSNVELFVAHSTWGASHGKDVRAGFSSKTYAEWVSDYDVQLEALFNALCTFNIESATNSEHRRRARITLGWLPPGSTLVLVYDESWTSATDSRQYTVSYVFGEARSILTTNANFSATLSEEGMLIEPLPHAVTTRPLQADPNLRHITLCGRLRVKTSEDSPEIRIPHDNDVMVTLH